MGNVTSIAVSSRAPRLRDTMRPVLALKACVLFALAAVPCAAHGGGAQEQMCAGNAAFLRGDLELAIRCYSDAIQFDSRSAVAYNNRGYALLRKGETDKAIADYDAALRLDANNAKAHFFRGSLYEDLNDQDKAVADYTVAVRLDPGYARAYCSRGLTAREPPIFADCPVWPSREVKRPPEEANWFVAPNGNDHNPGTIQQPFATLYKAHQWVRPGETINLRAGTYQALISWRKSGTSTAPITIQAYGGEDVRLQSSEQYTWTRVADPAFGDCWKTAIAYRPVRYPGVQHTVWEDTVRAAREPGIGIWAIVRGGYPFAVMNAAADFARPQAAAGLPLTDKGGKLLYDITWFDRNTKTLWFKLGPSRVTDPNRQLYVTSTASGQFSLDGSYVKLNGLKFEYLYFFHQQPYLTGCAICNCAIKHACGGFCGGGADVHTPRCSSTRSGTG